MARKLDIEAFLAVASPQEVPILDVRSPGEFEQGHVPHAVNLPLFDDAERAEIGTLYKQQSREAAVERGLEIVGPKMIGFVRQAKALTPDRQLRVHCWRGGMRSESMGLLMETAGFEVHILRGGYKAFRHHVLAQLGQPFQLIVLGGKTGSGKTDILKAMAAQGEQVIDLEGLAHHKGSAFGALGQPPQPSSESFSNQLYAELASLDRQRPIWVEDESHNIGKVHLPDPFKQQMATAPVIAIELSIGDRVERLVREYADADDQDLRHSLQRIERRLGGQHVQAALAALHEQDYHTASRIVLRYYDKAYQHGLEQRSPGQVHVFPLAQDDPPATAQALLRYANNHLIKV
jgi:tRNA 2-selenouridine synthase